MCYLPQVEPKMIEKTLNDESWVNTMHEKLYQFTRNNVWDMVPKPENYNWSKVDLQK